VTLNAIDQTLPRLLTRIARRSTCGTSSTANLLVMPDSPYLRIYKIDYVNMEQRDAGTVSVSSEIVGQQTGGAGGAGRRCQRQAALGAGRTPARLGQNRSATLLEDAHKNVEEILRETDKLLPGHRAGCAVAAAPVGPRGAPGQPAAARPVGAQPAGSPSPRWGRART
jgi:general secretion pathway protein D